MRYDDDQQRNREREGGGQHSSRPPSLLRILINSRQTSVNYVIVFQSFLSLSGSILLNPNVHTNEERIGVFQKETTK